MPQLAGAAAAWAVTAWTSAVTVVNTAMVAAAGAALPGLSFSAQLAVANFATKAVVFGGLAAASAALMRPNIPSSGTSLDFKPDPKAPVRGAMGYTALGGNKVFQATWGYKKVAMSLGVALSLGPIDQVPRFEADGATVSFTGQQNEATGFYAADMWQRTTLGLPGDAALLPPTGLKYGNPGLTGWGTQHAAPQTAFSFWTMVLAKNPEDRDVFTNGVPDPRWVGRWMKVWQPRYDSTYPGGSGPQRRDDWRTWGWSENPYDHALAWVRGHYKLNLDGSIDRTKRIAGIGAPDSAIDIPAFVEGANIADANGWTISGEWSTGDGKFQTLLAMLQAGGGEPISRGAQISVLVNAPRVATYTYTRDDLIGQAEIRPLTPRRERKNTIIPRYKSEANGWQYVPAGEVTSDVYRDEDRGEPRSLEIEYTHVRNAKQAGQLAAYDLANLREGLTATLPSKVHLMHVHPGACITVDVPELALAGQKFIVRRATTNHQAASVTLELRSESDGKHAWALGQAAQPAPSPSLSAVDPKYVPPPAAEDWTVLPKPPGDGGVSQPIFVIEAPVETTDIVAVIIKHGPSASGPWTDGYEGSPRADGRYEVAGLTPGQTYCVSLQYVAKNGAKSEPSIKCGIVAGDLIAGDIIPTAPTIVSIRSDIEAAFGDIFNVSELVGQTRADLEAADQALAGSVDRVAADLQQAENQLSAAIGVVSSRAETLEQRTASLDAEKASVTALNAQVARIGEVEAVNAAQAAALVDLENGKVALSEYNTLKVEVASARDGSPSLLGKIQSLKAVDLDLQQNKASVQAVSALGVRTESLEADITGLQLVTADLEARKATSEALNAQRVRINDVEAVNAAQALALVDLENGKVALSEYNTIKGEVLAARDGAPSLLGQIQSLKSVDLDLQNNKASVASVDALAARTAHTEADIIDLENALANETMARAETVGQLTARSIHKPNLIDNPSGAGAFRGWSKEGSPASYVDDDRLAGRIFVVYGYMVSQVYPAAPGDQHSLGFMASPVGDGGHVRLQYVTPGGLVEGVYVDAGGGAIDERRRSSAPSTAPAGTTGFRLVVAAPAGGLLPVWGIKVNFGSVAADFSDDYSTTVLAATVTDQSLAIVDLENQQRLASFRKIAEASGAAPAYYEFVSSTSGGYAAIAAPLVALLNSIPGGDPLVAMQAIAGEVFFPRPVYVDLGGRRLIVGPGNGWVLWFGPDTINAEGATRTNGYFALGTDGKVYYGSAELGGGGGDSALRSTIGGSAGAATHGATWVNAGTTTFSNLPAGGTIKIFASGNAQGGMTVEGSGLGTTVNGEARVLRGTTVLATGQLIASVAGGDASASILIPTTPINAGATGAVTLTMQIRSTTTNKNIGGTGMTTQIYAEWTKNG